MEPSVYSASANSFEFTARAIRELNSKLAELDPSEVDAQAIYQYLLKRQTIPFHSYLKRWIYLKSEMEESFEQVTDSVYQDIIKQSFYERHTPFGPEESVRKPSAVIKGWLSRTTVHRNTMFLLGMGLGMTEEEVSDFLKKACRDHDFDLFQEEEVFFWHCLKTGKDYAALQKLKEQAKGRSKPRRSDRFYEAVRQNPGNYLFQETVVLDYVSWLRSRCAGEQETKTAIFTQLYRELGEALKLSETEITVSMIEKHFYIAIPRTEGGNLKKAADSALDTQILGYRLTRQRLHGLLTGTIKVSRSDLITLLFFICSIRLRSLTPDPQSFIRKCNEVLAECGMYELYMGDPYEAFLTIALYTEYPLELYSDILEMSYGISYQ